MGKEELTKICPICKRKYVGEFTFCAHCTGDDGKAIQLIPIDTMSKTEQAGVNSRVFDPNTFSSGTSPQHPEKTDIFEYISEPGIDNPSRLNSVEENQTIYKQALECASQNHYKAALNKLESIKGYHDADVYYANLCEIIYRKSISFAKHKKYSDAITGFTLIPNYKNSQKLLQRAKNEQQKVHSNKNKQKRTLKVVTKVIIIIAIIIAVIFGLYLLITKIIVPWVTFNFLPWITYELIPSMMDHLIWVIGLGFVIIGAIVAIIMNH